MYRSFGQFGKGARHTQEQFASGIGQFHPVGPAQEDLLAKAILQQADVLADGCGADAQLLRGGGKAARTGRLFKGLKRVQGQAVAHLVSFGARERLGLWSGGHAEKPGFAQSSGRYCQIGISFP